MKFEKSEKKYFLGLDIGTDSVGYAATDSGYKLLKFNGEPMIGTHLFDTASIAAERRAFRSARRRLDRRVLRIQFVREIFAGEISKTDPDFYRRLDGSALFAEDKFTPSENSFFNDPSYTDKEYHRDYPTIHHLICDLMHSTAPRDARLVYLAVSYLVAHRGHFLNEADKDDIESVLDFGIVYSEFMDHFEERPWECDPKLFSEILKKRISISSKKKELLSLLFGGKPTCSEDDEYNKEALVSLLSGGKVSVEKLFCNESYSEIPSVALSSDDDTFNSIISELGDDGELLILAKKLYDWSMLTDLLNGETYISEAKVKIYEKHCSDLKFLKYFIKKYLPKKYGEVFRRGDVKGNYVSYSYNLKSVSGKSVPEKKATKEEFCEYIRKTIKGVSVDECDREKYEDMVSRLDKDVLTFMPKQVDGDNRLIPYQLYYSELKKLLGSCSKYLPFLSEKDGEITVEEKLLSVFMFRVPYFVGPLNSHSKKAWLVRKAEKIYPWNFDNTVDLDASEDEFIRRMTNTCTYMPGEKVLAKNSLLYTEFSVLNEINNLKINGYGITVEQKLGIFNDLFMKHAKVTGKNIENYLKANGHMQNGDVLSGIDITVKASLKPYCFFKPYIDAGILTADDVEGILEKKAYSEDNYRFAKYLKANYPKLSPADCKKISSQKFKEFGRLSRKFLCELYGEDKATGEHSSIIEALRNTNNNLMELLSDRFTFKERLDDAVKEYYSEHKLSLSERLDEMYVSNAVKRPIIRTLDIVKDVAKATGGAPEKIFVEMARDVSDEKNKKRTVSRRDQILEFYRSLDGTDELTMLKEQLSETEDRALNSDKLYLYFTQLGKCMYSGQTISIDDLAGELYNIDHIYPQSFVKDDSMKNRVLVLSTVNGQKSDTYPIDSAIRSRMSGFWKSLLDKGLIPEEKYKRLTRQTAFTAEEKLGFINRQLVETRQSTKAVASLLKEIFPETEIVYVKAGLVSDFRQKFDLLKSRTVNDLHHAKDAYLNIVVGNVYHGKFTSKYFFADTEKYSVKTETLFTHRQTSGSTVLWDGERSLAFVKETVMKNNIHLTRFPICQKGGFFDQMPVKASENAGLIPRKKGLDVSKYGGYNKTTASFFVLVKFRNAKKTDLMFMPVELLFADKFLSDPEFAEQYTSQTVAKITNKEPDSIEFPLGKRTIKINTVIELDGFRAFICGKGSGGAKILLSSLVSLKLSPSSETYIKRLEKFAEKLKKDVGVHVSPLFDKITAAENISLYDIYIKKSKIFPYNKMPGASVSEILESGRDTFLSLCVEEQVSVLMNIGSLFKSCRKGACDMSKIKGKSSTGSLTLSSQVSNWKKKYSSAYIIDTGASGLHESRSIDLFKLL